MKNRALIIDDNPSDQLLNRNILESLGFECTISCDGEDAIGPLTSQKFDLILLDLKMPNINGIQFLMGFRNATLNSRVPVIVISSRDDSVSRDLTRNLGAKAFIQKPLVMGKHYRILIKYLEDQVQGFRYG